MIQQRKFQRSIHACAAAMMAMAACSPAAQPAPEEAKLDARIAVGDYDGDGAEDRAELWLTSSGSRLLLSLSSRSRGAVMLVHQAPRERASDYVRTRAPGVYGDATAQHDVISTGRTDGSELIFYWDGSAFQSLALND